MSQSVASDVSPNADQQWARSDGENYPTAEVGGVRRGDLTAWLQRWQATYPRLCDWIEANVEPRVSFYRLPRQHHKHMKSTNMLERLNKEIRRRTRVRIFPSLENCLRLLRALAVEIHQGWLEASRYLNMDLLREHKKEQRRQLDQAG